MLTRAQIDAVKEDIHDKYRTRASIFSILCPTEFTSEEVIERLQSAVAMGLESAVGHRGLSSWSAHTRVAAFLWVLEDTDFVMLEDYDQRIDYGLEYFKAVANKYNVPIPLAAGIQHVSEDDQCSCS